MREKRMEIWDNEDEAGGNKEICEEMEVKQEEETNKKGENRINIDPI